MREEEDEILCFVQVFCIQTNCSSFVIVFLTGICKEQ